MPKIGSFEKYAEVYDAWFDDHPWAFRSEVAALRRFWPEQGLGLEVGAGTGRFAKALGVSWGVEPSPAMRTIARRRGIEVLNGTAEALPFEDKRFDAVLMVTTLCFLDDPDRALAESRRVLKDSGLFVAGFVDGRSDLGKVYQERRGESRFYCEARFWDVPEVMAVLLRAGFSAPLIAQTLFHSADALGALEPVKPGYGEGSFVVIAAWKEKTARRVPARWR